LLEHGIAGSGLLTSYWFCCWLCLASPAAVLCSVYVVMFTVVLLQVVLGFAIAVITLFTQVILYGLLAGRLG